MFKIVSYRNKSGKILITIETDDQTATDFLRFFGAANKFVELFHYRIRTAKNTDLYQKTRPDRMALAKKKNAEQLERYRKLSGTRIQKMRMLKEIRVSNGEKVTLDRIEAELSSALKDEKKSIFNKINQLLENKKSLNNISTLLNLPKTTIARHIKKNRGGLQESAPVNRRGLSPAEGPPEPPHTKNTSSA